MYQNPSSLDTDLQNENDPQKSGELSSNFERAEFVSKTPEKIHPFAEKPVKSSTKKTSGDQLSDQVNDMELKMDKMQKQIDEINLKHSKQKDGLEEKHSPLRVSFFYDLLSSTAELQNSDFCVRTAKEKGNPLIRIIEEALKYTSSVPQAISNYVQEHEKDIEKKTQARIESAFSQHQYSRPNITTIAENKMDLETSKGKGRSEKGVSEFEDDSTRVRFLNSRLPILNHFF